LLQDLQHGLCVTGVNHQRMAFVMHHPDVVVSEGG